MGSQSGRWWRPRRDSAETRPKLRDSRAIRRRRSWAGLVLIVIGLLLLATGFLTARVAAPPAVAVDPSGTTEVPRTYFFQRPWVLFGQVDDPRRVPSPAEIGCRPRGSLSLPSQPQDMTAYGSRVVDDDSIFAIALLSRSGSESSIECSGARRHAPLWLMPSSEAPTLTPTAITILAFALLVAGALTHPATTELRARGRRDRGPRTGRG